MPTIKTPDDVVLYYEEVGTGSPIVFVHEFAGDYRTWEPQLRRFARSNRCITFSQRGYPPSDVPTDPAKYSQSSACADVLALMDSLGVDKAHVVGHSMGAYTALHVALSHPSRCISVTAAGCGWGSTPDVDKREALKAMTQETGEMFATKTMAESAAIYADAPMRQAHKNKDPRGWAEFARMLSEHSSQGHALTMFNVQKTRPTLWEMEESLRNLQVPLLIVVGDEDDPCFEGSVFLKRCVPSAALLVIPRCGHTVTSEEPASFNSALGELFNASESNRWMAHRQPD